MMELIITINKIEIGNTAICKSPISKASSIYDLPLNSRHIVYDIKGKGDITSIVIDKNLRNGAYDARRFIFIKSINLKIL